MLANYLHSVLGGLASQLGWTIEADSYDFIISETLEKYGVDTETLATDTKKLHALGKVELWKAVLTEVTFDYSFSADGASYSRNQMYEMCSRNYITALTEALAYDVNYQIETGNFSTEHNPYLSFPEYSERER
jgi:hypothetical protein